MKILLQLFKCICYIIYGSTGPPFFDNRVPQVLLHPFWLSQIRPSSGLLGSFSAPSSSAFDSPKTSSFLPVPSKLALFDSRFLLLCFLLPPFLNKKFSFLFSSCVLSNLISFIPVYFETCYVSVPQPLPIIPTSHPNLRFFSPPSSFLHAEIRFSPIPSLQHMTPRPPRTFSISSFHFNI